MGKSLWKNAGCHRETQSISTPLWMEADVDSQSPVVLNGDMPAADWQELDRTEAVVLDVREPREFGAGHVPRAVNQPLTELRARQDMTDNATLDWVPPK